MTEVELSYIAGFFDGEGYVTVQYPKGRNGKRYKKLWVSISQVDRAVLDWICEQYGGGVYSKADKRVEKNGWQECFQYGIAYRQAEAFLKDILPYLKFKKLAAQNALEESYGPIVYGLG